MFWVKRSLFLIIPVLFLAACGANKEAAQYAITDVKLSNDVDTCKCGGYNTLLRNGSYDKKYNCALKYYHQKKYDKAMGLFEELAPIGKGGQRGEECAFLFAFCNFHEEDYESASFYFMVFGKNYPYSPRAEEAAYMVAYCAYLSSPDYNLDPTNTYRGIQELQLFIDRYPASSHVATCNTLIDKLRHKLELKDYYMAKQYYRMRQYKAAIQSFKNLINDYPETEFREECVYLIIKSAYDYANESVDSKKYERYKLAVDNYLTFKSKFPQSPRMSELTGIYDNSVVLMEKYKPFKVL